MPIFIHDVPNGLGEYGYYGLPMIDVPGMPSVRGVKVSAHCMLQIRGSKPSLASWWKCF